MMFVVKYSDVALFVISQNKVHFSKQNVQTSTIMDYVYTPFKLFFLFLNIFIIGGCKLKNA